MYSLPSLFLTLLLIGFIQADWFDDIVSGIHGQITSGADYLKDKAAPAVRNTFNNAKDKLKDPKTHQRVRDWLRHEALPAIKAKVDAVVAFLKREVIPELQDIKRAYDIAAKSDNKKSRS
ncbi:unnamed protein product [Thelazia callipaeda]|uniref:RxLR effector protein n=1 Tax=Thelazia callipaeda TaxID=103827 RepID=A0A0N5D298_THECL|nr:unnamed protein product [Thelazia callipaeda]